MSVRAGPARTGVLVKRRRGPLWVAWSGRNFRSRSESPIRLNRPVRAEVRSIHLETAISIFRMSCRYCLGKGTSARGHAGAPTGALLCLLRLNSLTKQAPDTYQAAYGVWALARPWLCLWPWIWPRRLQRTALRTGTIHVVVGRENIFGAVGPNEHPVMPEVVAMGGGGWRWVAMGGGQLACPILCL